MIPTVSHDVRCAEAFGLQGRCCSGHQASCRKSTSFRIRPSCRAQILKELDVRFRVQGLKIRLRFISWIRVRCLGSPEISEILS